MSYYEGQSENVSIHNSGYILYIKVSRMVIFRLVFVRLFEVTCVKWILKCHVIYIHCREIVLA